MEILYPATRFVFDRKHVASNNKKGLIQLEVRLGKKRKWISTGVKVYKDQWNDKQYVINSFNSEILNSRLHLYKGNIDEWINYLISNNIGFSWEALDIYVKRMNTSPDQETFVDFVARRIEERNDIKPSTKANHRKLLGSLDEFGRIIYFSDLTKANVSDYYNFLLGRETLIQGKMQKMKQTTVEKPH